MTPMTKLISEMNSTYQISMIRGITRENDVMSKIYEFSNMADSRHFGFGNSAIRDLMVDKHLGDFSCPGTS